MLNYCLEPYMLVLCCGLIYSWKLSQRKKHHYTAKDSILKAPVSTVKLSSRVIFLQITPYSYFKLIRRTPIDGQTTARHGPDARGPQLWPRHVMPACWLCWSSPSACRPIWLNGRKMSSRVIFLQITPYSYFKLIHRMHIDGQTATGHNSGPGTSCRPADCVGPAR
jgi:hypothetical protein